jgi:hypothetical protein
VAIGKIGKRTSNGEDDATGNECRGHTKSDSGRQLPPPHQQAVTTPHMRVYTAATARGNPTLGCFKVGAICNTTSLRCNPTFGWFKVGVPCIATSLRCNPTFEWHNDGQSEVGITTATSQCSRTSCDTSIRGAPAPNPRANQWTPHGGRNGQAEATEQAAATRATRATSAHNAVVYPHGSGLPPPQTGTPTRVSQQNVPSWHCHVTSGG